jgi:hypothetical protein
MPFPNLDAAKQQLRDALNPRIEAYRARLRKPWYDRWAERLSTNFGEAGYIRTVKFLQEMENIRSTAALVQFMGQPRFHEGEKMSAILKNNLLSMAGVTTEQIDHVTQMVVGEVMRAGGRHTAIAVTAMEINRAGAHHIFDKIVASHDCGFTYLTNLEANRIAEEAAQMTRRNI